MTKRKWRFLLIPLALVLILTACATPEEQAVEGVHKAAKLLEETPEQPNEKIGDYSVFLPGGFTVEAGSNAPNILLQNNNDTYVLFINENEPATSRLYYDLLESDPSKEIVEQATNELSDQFGFAAVVKHSEEQFELIVSRGGIKLSTVTNDSSLDKKLTDMMQVVHSFKKEEDSQ
ncbi:hypothetical protein MKY84_06860 [Chryseomicrobium sp. FSL W7-1435]|uniref:hypothetical protein n=1 Tax=Chryseomicrobium sp. FSL W7-1435 TaxID=2921704 RepID=UPI00315B3715